MPPTSARLTREQLERVLQELQVQHIELQVQNRELQDAQQVIEESRRRYTDLYDFAPIGYCTLDNDGHVKEANLTAARLFSLRRVQLIGRQLASLTAPADRRAVLLHLRKASDSVEAITTEVKFKAPLGADFVVQLVSIKRHDGVLTAMIDVSALKELERKLSHLAYAGDVLAASLDAATTLSVVSHLVVPHLGDLCFIDLIDEHGHLSRPEVLFADGERQARFADSVRHATLEPGWETPQRRCIATSEPMLLEDAAMSGAGEAVPWLAGMSSMIVVPLTARKRVLGTLTLVSAESARRYQHPDLLFAQEIARRAATALDNSHLLEQSKVATHQRDNLLATVSHDLKNPLTVIFVKVAQLLRAAAPGESRNRSLLSSIMTAADRMKQLIGDLLEIARIEGGGLAVEQVSTPARALLDEAVEEARPIAAEHSIELVVELADEALAVACDRNRILQVLSNLIGNAIKFSPERAAITIGAKRRGSEAVFSIADRGAGIAEDHLSHVFDRFWQAKGTARLGTGLGLAIVKGIVTAHRGDVWVERRSGGGGTFSFSLRLAEARLAVIVDDNPADRELLTQALEREGYRVATAPDGAAGLALLRQGPPASVVLLDLQMPVMDGWEFLAERGRDDKLKAVPVVVVSGQRDVAARIAAEGAGWLPKPYQVPELLAEIRKAAATPREVAVTDR